MTVVIPDILARIVEHKRQELAACAEPLDALERRAEGVARRDFAAALRAHPPAVIAEIKKASPSKGLLVDNFDPAQIARDYNIGGASALSVLTDQKFFQGSLADLETARNAAAIPALRKDFTISRYHVAEAAAHGADAILLIVAILTVDELRDFREYAAHFGMASLVEVHDSVELEQAKDSGAEIIGVNNRDLRTFDVRLETSERLASQIPAGVIRVSESGIHGRADVERLTAAGYNAFLVGEHLMKSGDPARAIAELRA